MTKALLPLVCCFTGVLAIWLMIMETVLRHEGFAMRIVVAGCILLQSSATLLIARSDRAMAPRLLLATGALAIAWLGVSATVRMVRGEHFEGFVLILGSALVLQAGLTLIKFVRADSLA